MSFLFGGQLSTEKIILQFLYIFIVLFTVWAGINFDSSPICVHFKASFPVWAGIKIRIPAQTGNGTIKVYTNCKINIPVDN